jgi:ABC-type transporter Mla subunit MlaD
MAMGMPWLPEIPGDPAGMRALASAVRGDARSVSTLTEGIGTAIGNATFEGPAATAIRDRLASYGRSLGDVSQGLEALAGRLDTAAAEVEQQQAERERRLAQLMREWLEAQGVRA